MPKKQQDTEPEVHKEELEAEKEPEVHAEKEPEAPPQVSVGGMSTPDHPGVVRSRGPEKDPKVTEIEQQVHGMGRARD